MLKAYSIFFAGDVIEAVNTKNWTAINIVEDIQARTLGVPDGLHILAYFFNDGAPLKTKFKIAIEDFATGETVRESDEFIAEFGSGRNRLQIRGIILPDAEGFYAARACWAEEGGEWNKSDVFWHFGAKLIAPQETG